MTSRLCPLQREAPQDCGASSFGRKVAPFFAARKIRTKSADGATLRKEYCQYGVAISEVCRNGDSRDNAITL